MVSVHGATVHRPTSISYLSYKKRLLRLIYFAKPRDHAIPFYAKSNCHPLQSSHFQRLSCLMHHVHTKTLSTNLFNKFVKISKTHHYDTHLSTNDYVSVEFSRIN